MLGLAVCLAIGAAIRIAFFLGAPVFVEGDSFQYYAPAQRLESGRGFPLLLKHPPAYPLFLFAIIRLSGYELSNIVAVQTVLGLGTVALSYGIGRLAMGRGAAIAAGLAAAVGGNLLVEEHFLMSEALFTFQLALATFLFLVGLRRGWWWAYVGSGLAVGLAALTRPHAQILPLVFLTVALFHFRRPRPVLEATVLLVGAAALLVVPWMIRNKVVHDSYTIAGRIGQSLVGQAVLHRPGAYVYYDPAEPPSDESRKHLYARQHIQKIINLKLKEPDLEESPISIHRLLMRNLKIGEAEADALMRDVTVQAIRRAPMTFVRYTIEDSWQIFQGEPVDFRRAWKRSGPGKEVAKLTTLMTGPTPSQERGYSVVERLVGTYQASSLGPVVPILYGVGLLASMIVARWRLVLLPGLVALCLNVSSAAIAGFNPRFHDPANPLVHVVAVAGACALWLLAANLLGRLRGASWQWSPRAIRPSGGLALRTETVRVPSWSEGQGERRATGGTDPVGRRG